MKKIVAISTLLICAPVCGADKALMTDADIQAMKIDLEKHNRLDDLCDAAQVIADGGDADADYERFDAAKEALGKAREQQQVETPRKGPLTGFDAVLQQMSNALVAEAEGGPEVDVEAFWDKAMQAKEIEKQQRKSPNSLATIKETE